MVGVEILGAVVVALDREPVSCAAADLCCHSPEKLLGQD